MNVDSFTDEQLLNLINNTIVDNTENEIDTFTGGYIQMTLTKNKKSELFKIVLLFGYGTNRNSISFTKEIPKAEIYIWQKAIMLKLSSTLLKDIGSDLNALNDLMKDPKKREKKEKKKESSSEFVRSGYEKVSISTISLPNISLSNISLSSVRSFIDLKYKLVELKAFKTKWEYEGKEVCIYTDGVPYEPLGQKVYSKAESDLFYKYLFRDLEAVSKKL